MMHPSEYENVAPVDWTVLCTCGTETIWHPLSCPIGDAKVGAFRLLQGIDYLLALTAEITRRQIENPLDWS